MSVNEATRLAELATDKLVLEVGAWHGFSTIMLAQTAQHVHSVDWHRGDEHVGGGDTLFPFMINIERHKLRGSITVHLGRIEDVAPVLREQTFDLCFLDALHTHEAVQRDINLVRPLVRSGGQLVFHDYGHPRFGVTQAVDGYWVVDEVVDTLAVVTL
jgi:predicted O-methyltransferase YrrM